MGATSLDLSQIKTDVLSAASTFRALIGLGNVNNTADLDKPISTATQGALDLKANSSDLSSYLPLTGGTVSGQVLFSGTGSGLGLPQLASSASNWFIYSGGTFQSPLFNCNGWFGMVDGASGGLQFFSGHGIVWSGSGTFGSLTRNSLTGDAGLYRDGIGTLAQRFGTNAQRLNLYGTYTDASNYRRLYISSTTAGAFTLGVEGLGTGASGNTLSIANSFSVSGNVTATSFISSSLTITGGSPSNIVSSNRLTFTGSAAYIFYKSGNSFSLDPSGSNAATFGGAVITTGPLTANGGSLTASVPALNASQTWNNAAVAFNAMDINVTNTASAIQSTFATFRRDGTNRIVLYDRYDNVAQGPAVQFGAGVVQEASGGHVAMGTTGDAGMVGLSNGLGLSMHPSRYIGWGSTGSATRNQSSVWADVRVYRGSGPSLQIQAAGGLKVFNLDGSANASITSGPIEASTVASTNKGLIVRGSAAQSANLVEVQDVSQNVLVSIDKDGDVVANSGSFHTVQLTSDTPRQSGVLFLDNNKLLTTSTNFIHDNSNPASPKLIFKASGNATPDISLNVLTSASGSSSGVQTLSFEGSAGQLFSISDVLNSGTIFGVNDISGLPLLEVDATGLISLARFGTGINAHRTINCLQGVSGTSGVFTGAISAASASFTGQVNANNLMLNSYQWIGWGGNNFVTADPGIGLRLNNVAIQQVSWLGFGSSNDLKAERDAANIWAQRNGVNAQTFRIYNAFTDASNYDRAFARWNSNVFEIGTERAGTYSTTRSLSFVFNGTTRGSISPTGGVWFGNSNTATDQSAVICGLYNNASIPYSAIVGGVRGNTYLYGQTVVAFGGRPFNAANLTGGVCQSWLLTISGYTTDATQTRMRAGDTSATWDYHQRLTVRSGYTVSYLACIKGIKSDGTARARFWRLIDITRIGNTTALDVAAETIGTDHNPSSCTITIQADDTNEALEILVGGVAGETWRWTGTLYATEMQYGT